MADKRLDQENVLTDLDYALIVKGTDVAKISKADLANVVGGLIGFFDRGIDKLKVKQSSDPGNFLGSFKMGLLFIYDNTNKDRFYIGAFHLNYGVRLSLNVIHNNILTVDYPKEYGSCSASGGSGSYLYTAIGI